MPPRLLDTILAAEREGRRPRLLDITLAADQKPPRPGSFEERAQQPLRSPILDDMLRRPAPVDPNASAEDRLKARVEKFNFDRDQKRQARIREETRDAVGRAALLSSGLSYPEAVMAAAEGAPGQYGPIEKIDQADFDERDAEAARLAAGDASWMETARKAFQNIDDQILGRGGGGLIESLPTTLRYLGAVAGVPGLAMMPTTPSEESIEEFGRGVFQRASAEIERNSPDLANSPGKQFAYDAITSFSSLLTAVGVTAATRSPTAGSAVLGAQVFGDRFAQSIEEGRTREEALRDGAIYGFAEMVGERAVLGNLLKPGQKLAARVTKGALGEALQESVTSVIQNGYAKGILYPEMTMAEALEAIRYDAALGAASGGAAAIVTHPFRRREAEPKLGIVEQAQTDAARNITPEDEASPIPTDLIQQGKATVAGAEASRGATEILSREGIPGPGRRVVIQRGDRTQEGIVEDAFTVNDLALGESAGVKIRLDDGSVFEEFFDTIRDTGTAIKAIDEVRTDPLAEVAVVVPDRRREEPEPEPPARLPLPVQGKVTSPFGRRRSPKAGASTDHGGVDIAAPVGTPVEAPADGVVVNTGKSGKRGNWVEIDHGNGVVSRYFHLDGFDVARGDTVRQGQTFARTGQTGNVTGPHLHWSVLVNGKPVDPLATDVATGTAARIALPAEEAEAPRRDDNTFLEEPVARTEFAPVEEPRAFNLDEVLARDAEQQPAGERPSIVEPERPTITTKGKTVIVANLTEPQRAAIDEALPGKTRLLPRSDGSFSVPAKYESAVRAVVEEAAPVAVPDVPAAQPIRVFHGGPGVEGDIRAPLFVSPDREFAQSYAEDRGRGAGTVEEFEIQPSKIATEADIQQAAKTVGVPETQIAQSYGGILLDEAFTEQAPQVAAELRNQAFDVASFRDFAVDEANETRPAMVVLDPAIIRRPEPATAPPSVETKISGAGQPSTVAVAPEASEASPLLSVARDEASNRVQQWYKIHYKTPAGDVLEADLNVIRGRGTIDIGGNSTNQLGPKGVRALLNDLATQVPELEVLEGYRATGAKRAARDEASTNAQDDAVIDVARLRQRLVPTSEPASTQPSGKTGQFNPAPYIEPLKKLIAETTIPLDRADRFASQLGITEEQARITMGALASRPDSGIRMTKGSPAKVQRIQIKSEAYRPSKKDARKQVRVPPRYKQTVVRPAIPPRLVRVARRKSAETLMERVRRAGGVRSDAHDLRNVGALARYPGVISSKGRSVDELGELLHEEGWFAERPTEAEVIELLDQGSTRRTVHPGEGEAGEPDLRADEARADVEAVITEAGYEFTEEETDDAARYVLSGDSPEIAVERARDDAAARSLQSYAETTGDPAYEVAAENVYEGEFAEDRDRGAEEGDTRPEAFEGAAPGREPSPAQPEEGGSAGLAEEQLDAFGIREGDERRALERKGEGRLKTTATQKPPGSEGGLFDNNAPQADIEGPIAQAKAALQQAMDALEGVTTPPPANDVGPVETDAQRSLIRDWESERQSGRKPSARWVVRRKDDGSIVSWSVKKRGAEAAQAAQWDADDLEVARVQPADFGIESTAPEVSDEEPQFRRADTEIAPVDADTAAQWRTRLLAELDRLNISDRVTLNVVNKLEAGPTAAGSYYRKVISVALDVSRDPVETLSHESIHAMRALGLFRPAEWTALEKAVEASPELMADVRRRYGAQGLSDLQMTEEAVADLYGLWRAQRAKVKGLVATAFQRIADFIKTIRAALAGEIMPGQVFRDVEAGRVGARESGMETEPRQPLFDFAPPTDSAAFRRWFGNSKVVDEARRPLVVYHGTAEAREMLRAGSGYRPGHGRQMQGIYLSPLRSTAQAYARTAVNNADRSAEGEGEVVAAYAAIRNPATFRSTESFSKANRQQLEAAGHDGALRFNQYGELVEVVAFDPTQIKSVDNRGTFDPDDPRMRFSILRRAAEATAMAGGTGGGGRNTGTTSPTFNDPDSEARWQDAAKGLGDGPGLIERAKGWWDDVAIGFSRHWRDLPNEARFADLAQQFRKLEAAPNAAKERTVRLLRDLVGPLDKAQLDLFTRKVVLDDLTWEADAERQLPFGFTAETLAVEKAKIDRLVDEDPAIVDAVRKRKLVNREIANEMVAAGVLSREQIRNPAYFRHMVLDYARAEMRLAKGTGQKIKSPYWAKRMGSSLDINAHLLEAEFEWLQKAQVDIATAKTIDWLKKSEHNIRDDLRAKAKELNDEALETILQENEEAAAQAMGFRKSIAMGMKKVADAIKNDELGIIPDHLQEAAQKLMESDDLFALLAWILDNDKPGAIGAAMILKASGQRKSWERQLLGGKYIDPNDTPSLVKKLAPDGYAAWQPIEGRHLFTAKTVPEHILEGFVERLSAPNVTGIPADEMHRALTAVRSQLVVGGERYTMVVPKEVADTLTEFGDRRAEGLFSQGVQMLQGAWKRWVLINPRRFLKYNLNNLSGDLDALIAGNPGALLKVRAAAKELYAVMRNGEKPSARYEEAVERGVFDSGLSVQEIPDISRLSAFRHLTDDHGSARPDKLLFQAAGNVWRALQGSTQWRENVFRYASYLDYIEKIEGGRPTGYGASVPKLVDAVKDPKDKAALLARDLIGDYGAISVAGGWLRRHLIPFWSWTEINTKRYWRLTSNAWSQGAGKGIVTGGALAISSGARISAALYIRMALFYGLVTLWNNLLFGDEEDELGEQQQRQMHIILGRYGDEIVTLRIQGALSDVLSLMGLPDAAAAFKKYLDGQGSIGATVGEMAKAPVNKVATGTNPFVSVPLEQAMGKELWPDIFSPRDIKDRWRHVFSTISLENEYDFAFAKPSRGYIRSWQESILYRRDPGEMAYDEAKGIAYDWLERVKGEGSTGSRTSPKSTALRDYRQALRFGDEQAAEKALRQYESFGGTNQGFKASIKRQHPLGPIAKKDRQAFLDSLTEEQYETFALAEQWYDETFLDE